MSSLSKFTGTWQVNSRGVIIVTVSTLASVGLIGVLAHYLRRRRPKSTGARNATYVDGPLCGAAASVVSGSSSRRAGSLYRSSYAGPSLLEHGQPPGLSTEQLTPQQLGAMGMEAVETAITYWEDALEAYRRGLQSAGGDTALAVTTAEEAEFTRDLQKVLDAAYRLQGDSELLFLDQRSVLFRAESSIRSEVSRRTLSSWSSRDSFVSAQDEVADLRDLEGFAECPDLDSLPLYQAAVRQYEEGGIPYRCLRTELLRCSSDVEFQCKLHCVRMAFTCLLREPGARRWICDSGRQILADLMILADKDPRDFLMAYEELLQFLEEPNNWVQMESELGERGVKAITFYDVALDLILMDAFEDLELPPTSVTSVVQNRWLSNGFKEAALSTCLCSLLSYKRRMLQNPAGFMSHFYTISEHVSPLLAWGFLGTDEQLKETCKHFKDHVMGFLQDMFSFERVRYTSVEELAEDIMSSMRTRVDELRVQLSPPPPR